MSSSRKAKISVQYKGKDITKQISPYIKSLTYTDIASGSSDSAELELIDRDKKWMGSWYPSKNDDIKVIIYLHNWDKPGTKKTFSCGTFTIDDLTYSGRPLVCNIGATSVPQYETFNSTQRTKTWKEVTVKEIAKEISKRSSLSLYYDADTINIASIEQSKETDCSFLYSLCQDYGLAMKVFGGKLIIFSEESYESKKAITTITETEAMEWSYNTTVAGTYTGARVSYTSPQTNETSVVKIGTGSRILEINVSASSVSDAEKKGKAYLRNQNKSETTMSMKIHANPKICASSCVTLTGFRKLSGKYYVDKVKHKVSDSSYSMELDMHLVES